jgi:hypothetical protein
MFLITKVPFFEPSTNIHVIYEKCWGKAHLAGTAAAIFGPARN